MQSSLQSTALGDVFLQVPGMLRAPGFICTSKQAACGRDVGRDCEVQGCAWPGRDLGVRCPRPGETALSWSEVHHGMKAGVL